MDAELYDKIADAELHALEKALGEIDPDELEVDLSQGVLTLEFSDGEKVIINSHRAAGEIWMAAFRKAWHFGPKQEGGKWVWRTADAELHATLAEVLRGKLGHPVSV
jgi:iron-sulfur cluster assembly protein CyaY